MDVDLVLGESFKFSPYEGRVYSEKFNRNVPQHVDSEIYVDQGDVLVGLTQFGEIAIDDRTADAGAVVDNYTERTIEVSVSGGCVNGGGYVKHCCLRGGGEQQTEYESDSFHTHMIVAMRKAPKESMP